MSSARPGAHTPGQPKPRALLATAVAAGVIAVDQLTKSLAQDHLEVLVASHVVGPVNFLLTFNRGAAFSMGSGVAPVIEAAAVALVVAVLLASRRLARRGANLTVTIGLGLLSGGALSNLADRFLRHHHGAVVDFIQLVSWWPVFNVADACITVGAILVAVNLSFSSSAEPPADGI